MISPFDMRTDDDNGGSKKQRHRAKGNLFREFMTRPLLLPIWLWNLLVIGAYIYFGWFLIRSVVLFLFTIGILSM